MIEPILRLPLRHEQTIWTADGTKQLEQRRVRRADFPAEEFHHAADLASITSGKPNAARSPSRAAIAPRGKFTSSSTSGIHAGAALAQTRPGRPTPAQSCTCGWPLRTP
jgi:hypothetical protein